MLPLSNSILDLLHQDDISLCPIVCDGTTESIQSTDLSTVPTVTSTRAGEENDAIPSSVAVATTATIQCKVLASDVLLGQSPTYRNNLGNQRMRELVKSRQEEHKSAAKSRKSQIVEEIINTMIKEGRRFLAKDSETEQWKLHKDRKKLHELVASRIRSITNKDNRKRKKEEVSPELVLDVAKADSKRKSPSFDPTLEYNLQDIKTAMERQDSTSEINPLTKDNLNGIHDGYSDDMFPKAWAILGNQDS